MSLSRSQRILLERKSNTRSAAPTVDMRKAAFQAPPIYGEFPRETIWRGLWREVKSMFSLRWPQPRGAHA